MIVVPLFYATLPTVWALLGFRNGNTLFGIVTYLINIVPIIYGKEIRSVARDLKIHILATVLGRRRSLQLLDSLSM